MIKVYLKTKKMTDISQTQAGCKAKSRCVCRNRRSFRLFRYTLGCNGGSNHGPAMAQHIPRRNRRLFQHDPLLCPGRNCPQGLQRHFRRVWQLCPARCRQAYAAAAPAGRPGHAGAPALYGTGCSAVPCAIPEADHLRSDPDARFDPGRGACHHGGRHPLRHYHPRRRR